VPLLLFGLLLIALPSFVLGREFSILWESMGGGRNTDETGNNHIDIQEDVHQNESFELLPSRTEHSGHGAIEREIQQTRADLASLREEIKNLKVLLLESRVSL